MVKPRRIVEKRQKRKKLITIIFLIILIVIFVIVGVSRLRVLDQVLGVRVLSPIPSVMGVKTSIGSFFSNPKDDLASNLRKAGVEFSDIYSSSNSSYIVKQKDGAEVYFTSSKSIPVQVATLQLILSRLTIEGKSFVTLDLRYDKPVIVIKK